MFNYLLIGIIVFLITAFSCNKNFTTFHKIISISFVSLFLIMPFMNIYENYYTVVRETENSSVSFYKGVLHGESVYMENGKIYLREVNSHGKPVWRESYYSNGKVKEWTGFDKNGVKNKTIIYDIYGSKVSEIKY